MAHKREHARPQKSGFRMNMEQHRRVLVVDDDHDLRDLLLAALNQKSLTVDTAADGKEAIDLLRENSYAVILLDLLMPIADGFAVLEAMEQSVAAPSVVLIVTGADRSVIQQLDARRIHGVVKKPFDTEELAAVVAACADLRGRKAFETMAVATMVSGVLAFFGEKL